ncbi:MAG: hypothetical protein NTNFB01_17320 [Nitrospira sp.]
MVGWTEQYCPQRERDFKERPIKEALLGEDLAAAHRLVNDGAHGLERFREAYTTGLQPIS